MSTYFNQVNNRGSNDSFYNSKERSDLHHLYQSNQNDLTNRSNSDSMSNFYRRSENMDSMSSFGIESDRHMNKRRTQFRPDLYETKSNRPSIEVLNMSPRAAIKAGGLRVAAKDIKSILRDLKPFISTQISELPEEVKDKFNRLAIYVQTLYNTSDYETLYAWVKQEYGHLTITYPGTVGSYMAGCMVQTSLTGIESGCAISCAASIPPPRSDPSFNHCENTVIHGRYYHNKYHFTIFRKADHIENHRDAYLYINSTDPINYPGFSDNEKRQLLEYGVERVKIYGFNSDGRNYVELTNDLVDIANIKSRNKHYNHNFNSSYHDYKPHERPHDSGSKAWWIIVIVVVVVIIFLLGWLYYSSSNKNYAYQYWSNRDSLTNQSETFNDDSWGDQPSTKMNIDANLSSSNSSSSSFSIDRNSTGSTSTSGNSYQPSGPF